MSLIPMRRSAVWTLNPLSRVFAWIRASGITITTPPLAMAATVCPKDTKQLLANYHDIPQNLISAIVKSNDTRKDFIVNQIVQKAPRIIGVYRLTMKSNSDNFPGKLRPGYREEASHERSRTIVIYEPSLCADTFEGSCVIRSLADSKEMCDVILANRYDEELRDVKR